MAGGAPVPACPVIAVSTAEAQYHQSLTLDSCWTKTEVSLCPLELVCNDFELLQTVHAFLLFHCLAFVLRRLPSILNHELEILNQLFIERRWN